MGVRPNQFQLLQVTDTSAGDFGNGTEQVPPDSPAFQETFRRH